MVLLMRLFRWLGTKRWFAVVGRYVLTPLDKILGRRGWSVTGLVTDLPLGHLTTVGRVSGNEYTTPLLFVPAADESVAVVGTNFGGDDHPHWANNLLANPRARWAIEGEVAVQARKVTEDEFAHLWPQFIAMWPAYEEYVSRSQRHPLMFVLEPL